MADMYSWIKQKTGTEAQDEKSARIRRENEERSARFAEERKKAGGAPATPPAEKGTMELARGNIQQRKDALNYAEGGPIVGPGTGTSDSIPINASNGEFIVPADVAGFLGTKYFDELVAKARAEMAGEQNPYSQMAGEMMGEEGLMS